MGDEVTADGGVKKPHLIRRLYDWVLHWAKTPYGAWALFLLAFAESSFFPIPPDVLLIALAISIPARSFRYAAICCAGSLIGGLVGYGIGALGWAAVHDIFIPLLFSQETFDRGVAWYEKHDFWIVFGAGFTPLPYKVATITAGVCHINLPMFLIASAVGRSARFFLVAALIRKYGREIQNFIEKYFNLCTIAFTLLLLGGFAVIHYWNAIAAFFRSLF